MKKNIVARMTSVDDQVWTLEVTHEMVVYKWTRTRFKNAVALSKEVTQGFAWKTALVKFKSGKDADLKLAPYMLVAAEFSEMMRKHGWPQSDHGGFPWTYSMMQGMISKTPYDDVVRGASLDRVVRIDSSNNTLLDRKGKFLPVGIWFGAGTGNINSRHMDLKRAVEVLEKDPAVILYKPRRGWGQGPAQYIHGPLGDSDVSYLTFVFAPTLRQYERMWKEAGKTKGGWVDRQKIAHDLDLLGLVKAGVAAKEYYAQTVRECECHV